MNKMSAADTLRRDLGYADNARERAKELDAMADWIEMSRETEALLVSVPEHVSRWGNRHARRDLPLTEADRNALIQFLRARIATENRRAEAIEDRVTRPLVEKGTENNG